jgi:uncharacterized protein with HEPN domain
MSRRKNSELLCDIMECIKRIKHYSRGLNFNSFAKDTKTQDAVVQNIEIIGEAVKKLPSSLTRKYSQIPWKEMARTRDKLIHDYFGVNYEILWNIIKKELPKLKPQIEKIISTIDR